MARRELVGNKLEGTPVRGIRLKARNFPKRARLGENTNLEKYNALHKYCP
ncbi:hypothetical protein GCM10028810_63610 [Spirosoma litoris]